MTDAPQPHVSQAAYGLGIAALVLGVAAMGICWVPVLGLLAIPVAALGGVLALIGLVVGLVRGGMGMPFAGGLTCLLALGFPTAQTLYWTQLMARNQMASERRQRAEDARRAAFVLPSAGSLTTPATTTGQALPTLALPQPQPQSQSQPSVPSTLWQTISLGVPVEMEGIAVAVVAATAGYIHIREAFGDDVKVSSNVGTKITIDIINKTPRTKMSYVGWYTPEMSTSRHDATLTDDAGNTYKQVTFGYRTRLVGAAGPSSLYPDEPIRDILVFERPVTGISELRLTLPLKAINGLSGELRLAIPADLIQWSRDRTWHE